MDLLRYKFVVKEKTKLFPGYLQNVYADRLHYKNFTLLSKCVCVCMWMSECSCTCVYFFKYIVSILLCFNILTTFAIFTVFVYQKYIWFHIFCLHSTSILHLFMHLLHFSSYFFCFTHFIKIQITVLFCFVIFFLP